MTSLKLTAKRILAATMSALPRDAGRDVVLLYHSVAGGPLSTPLTSFEAQVTWLQSHAHIVPLHQILERPNPGQLRVAITFDDGYATLYRHALLVLRQVNAQATVFLTTGMLAPEAETPSRPDEGHYPSEYFLSWEQVARLQAEGWTMACHGEHHLDSTTLGHDEFQRNVQLCQDAIARHTGVSPTWLAYTWGRFHDEHVRQALHSGMTHVFTCLHGPARRDAIASPHMIDRIDVRPDIALKDFAAMVRGDWDYLGWLQRARRRLEARHV